MNKLDFLNDDYQEKRTKAQKIEEELKIDIANAMSKGELGIQGEDYEQ